MSVARLETAVVGARQADRAGSCRRGPVFTSRDHTHMARMSIGRPWAVLWRLCVGPAHPSVGADQGGGEWILGTLRPTPESPSADRWSNPLSTLSAMGMTGAIRLTVAGASRRRRSDWPTGKPKIRPTSSLTSGRPRASSAHSRSGYLRSSMPPGLSTRPNAMPSRDSAV